MDHDPESPPASPGLVLRTKMEPTNANIDHFALDTPSRAPQRLQGARTRERSTRRKSSVARDTEDSENESFLTMSSDSYFSHHRDSLSEINRTPQSVRSRRRSDSSETGSLRSYSGSESDTDSLGMSPSVRRHAKRRSVASQLMNVLAEEGEDTRTESTSGSQRGHQRSGKSRRKDYMQPSQIFRSLFSMEQSLCEQYIQQTALRYRYLAFLLVMLSMLSMALYGAIFLEESDRLIEWKLVCRFGAVILAITLVLFYSSGMYHRTISRPRQFISSTNRGLRQFNIKLVRIRMSIYERLVKTVKTGYCWLVTLVKAVVDFLHVWLHLVPATVVHRLARYEATLRYKRTRDQTREVKIMLNPRAFNGSTRDQWEVYRKQQGLLERRRRV